MNEGHVAIVGPDIIAEILSVGLVAAVQTTDLGICCAVGNVCCERCAYNYRFRCGHPNYCLNDNWLIHRVQSGAKPVGSVHNLDADNDCRAVLENMGLEVLSEHVNQYGVYMHIFALPATGDTRFSDYIDLDALYAVCGLRLEDRTLRAHAVSHAFRNETDSMVERGILYGYPLWTSIARYLMNQ